MLTKGAIGNLVNRYRAVLKKCTLINTFGSLAVASMLVLGGAGVASAVTYDPATHASYSFTGNTLELSSLSSATVFSNASEACPALNITDKDMTGILRVINTEGMGFDSYKSVNKISVGELYIEAKKNLINMNGANGVCSIDINAKKVTLVGGDDGNLLQTQNKDASISITADEIYMKTKSGMRAIRTAENSKISVVSNKNLVIESNEEIKTSNTAKISIVANGSANIKASLLAEGTGDSLTLSISGPDSSIEGAMNGAGLATTLKNGATWKLAPNHEGDSTSNFGKLTSEGGIVDMSGADGNIKTEQLDGGKLDVIMDAAADNSFEVSTATDTQVTAIASENADAVSEAQAKKMVSRIAGA